MHNDQLVLLSRTPPAATVPAADDVPPWLSASQLSKVLKSDEPVFLVHLTQVDYEANLKLNTIAPAESTTQDINVSGLLDEYSDVFSEELPHHLPPDRAAVHRIPLESGHTPPFQRSYRISPKEMAELQKQLKDMIDNKVIQPSSSPYAALVIFVPKKDGSLRMCFDYRALNKITVKNRFPLPKMDELLNCLRGARFFSKIDLKSAYTTKFVLPKKIFLKRHLTFAMGILSSG